MNIKKFIKSEALKLGFLDVKFTSADTLTHEFQNYKEWLSRSYNADMHWMERNLDKRQDVSLILDNAKTVMVFSHSYFTGQNYPENPGDAGKISRYAWGDDYHEIIIKKLRLIEKKLKELHSEISTMSYVDTGPILERQWAVKSGLGWQGKNGMIINPKYGSYFFIGIIITDFEIQSDKKLKDMCGTCDECMTACPTCAIVQPKVVDSRKCLSYWTIESKENNMPSDIKENQKNWIFGCDICQEVCPWNKFSVPTTENSFLPRNGETTIKKSYIDSLDENTFRMRFRKSPIKRTKLKGMKKNFR